jgi:hypothetical protein
LPFTYLVVNQLSGTMGSQPPHFGRPGITYTTGAGTVPKGAPNFLVTTSAAKQGSTILLTVDATAISSSVHLPESTGNHGSVR